MKKQNVSKKLPVHLRNLDSPGEESIYPRKPVVQNKYCRAIMKAKPIGKPCSKIITPW